MAVISRELAFSLDEYQRRIRAVRQVMAQEDVDILLVHSLPGICYLTGFQTVSTRTYTCFVLPADAAPCLVTERDEAYNAKLNAWVDDLFTYVRGEDPVQVTIKAVNSRGRPHRRVGAEFASRYLSPQHFGELREMLAPESLIDSSNIVPRQMLFKSAPEIDCIRRAAAITALGMRAAVDAVAIGTTDNEVASAACQALIANGSEYMSSGPIVCAGRNAGIPHGHYARRTIARGDTVLLELSACVQRYSAPLMRSVTVGRAGPRVAAMAGACKRALEDVIARMMPGATFADAASAGKAAIAEAGPGLIFHGTYAYSVGLGFPGTSWADCPVEVREGEPGCFEPGMVFHLPMSLRDEGIAGVAFSETVLITEHGPEVLTHLERALFER
jgi:Xaa-Pro dipeptidase